MAHRLGGARRRDLSPLHRRLGFESLENRQLLAATVIQVHAAGSTGTEQFQLLIDGAAVATWNNTRVLTSARVFDTFTYTAPSDVTIDRIRVAFINDGVTPIGGDRNLHVDGVSINGAKYESEATTVYSTGTWDRNTNARLPGFRQTEALHYNGYLQYGAANSTIQFFAAGATGQEQMQLRFGGLTVETYDNVGGDYAQRQFLTYNFTASTALPISQIRIAFTNNGNTATGADMNLRVDALILDGIRYETEGADVLSTGTYSGSTPVIGHARSEFLHVNGYFQYGAVGTVIDVRAAGSTHEEQMQLLVNGQVVATFNNIGGHYASRQFETYAYVAPTTVPLSQIRVAFTNNATTAAGDRNLRIDGVVLDGIMNQSEASDVYSTATWLTDLGGVPGLWQTEYLHINGYLQFASGSVPGTLALGTTLVSVDEAAGTVSIPVTRTGGSDGTVAIRYSTVNGTATAGSDFTGASAALLVFGPGETTKSIVVPITNDSLEEGNETFNLAIDQPLGGASTGVPRTATITIVDNDGPPPPGTGNGLLGFYYDDDVLSQLVFERTDSTVNFNWTNGPPAPNVSHDTFSVRWVGEVEARFSETFTFRTTSDDGVRLWVNNQLIIDKWIDQGATAHVGSIALSAGQRYNLVLEYFERFGLAEIQLQWSSPSQPLQVIPHSQLYSDPPTVEDGLFASQTVVSGLSEPTAIDFDASGRMFVAEKRGVVRVYQDGALLPTPFLDIQSRVNNVADRGMLGVAVHPNFPATPYVYVSYTYDPAETLTRTGNAGPDGAGNRVARISRFTADAATGFNAAVPGSEVVLVGTNSTWANISSPHLDSTDDMSLPPSGGMNGTLHDILIADSLSHTIGNLAFGPDGMLYAANGDGTSYGRVDPRTVRVQDLDSLSGKILRVDPITGQGLADNPFFNGDPDANRSKVYNYGLRNPFRFAIQPGSGTLYVGDVGWTTWEELNRGRGENFGWPFFEGGNGVSLHTGGYDELPEAAAFYASNPDVQAPFWARRHDEGGTAIVAGDFYTGTAYPEIYQGTLFISDIGDNQMRFVRQNDDGTLLGVMPLRLNAGFVVEMTMGRDGLMYYADLVNGVVGRIVYTPPAAPLAAMAPLAGDLDGDGQVTGNDFLAWQRGLGDQYEAHDLVVWRDRFIAATTAPAASTRSLAEELGPDPFDFGVVGPTDEPDDASPAGLPLEPVLPNVYAQSADGAEGEVVSMAFDNGVEDNGSADLDAAFTSLGDDPFAWAEVL